MRRLVLCFAAGCQTTTTTIPAQPPAAPSAGAAATACVSPDFQAANPVMTLDGTLDERAWRSSDKGLVLVLDRPLPVCGGRDADVTQIQLLEPPAGFATKDRVHATGTPGDQGSGAGHFLTRFTMKVDRMTR